MHGSPDRSRAAAPLGTANNPHFAALAEGIDPHIQYAVAHLLQSLATGNGVEGEPKAPEPRSRKRRLPKYASREEIAALFAQPNLRSATGLRDRCLMELMYRSGLRVSEACHLEPRDVYLVNGQGRIRVIAGKSGDDTAYFDPASVWPLLERWKAMRADLGLEDCPWLFCTVKNSLTRKGGYHDRGRPVSKRAVERMMARRCLKAGVSHITPHMLRHTFATELLDEGFTIREVQALMRHANLKSTEIYLHLADASLGAKITQRERI
jgi:integrase/recombinase XerD